MERSIQHLVLFIPERHEYRPLRSVAEPPVLLDPDNVVAVVVADTVYLTHRHLVEAFAVGRLKLQHEDTFATRAWGTELLGMELMPPRPYSFGLFFTRELYGCCCDDCTRLAERQVLLLQEVSDYLQPDGFSPAPAATP